MKRWTLFGRKNYQNRKWEELVRMHCPILLGFLIKLTKDQELAEELSQQVWNKFLGNNKEIENIQPYLNKMAKNLFFDYLRTKKKKADVSVLSDSVDHSTSNTDSNLNFEEEQTFREELLGKRDFEIYQLATAGFNSREIAEKLDMNAKTVDNLRSIIKEKLKKSGRGY